MKKLVLSIILFATVGFAYAQTKGSVTKAEAYLKEGKLAEAKTEIENALAMELAKLKKKGKEEIGKGKTYLTQGKIYQTIALSEKEAERNLLPDAITKAMEAYNMVKKVEKENSMNFMTVYGPALPGSVPLISDFYQKVYQKGIDNFNAENYDAAVSNFKDVIIISPKDTIAAQNIYLCAQRDENDALGAEYARVLIDWGFKKPYLYIFLANKEMKKENFDAALKVLKEGMEANPGNIDLIGQEINIYIKSKREKEAITSLDKAIAKTPDNFQLHLNRGLLYRNLGNLDEAEKSLKKVIELNPTDIAIYKELGGLFYNNALDIKKKMNDLELNKLGEYVDKAAADKLQKEIDGLYVKAVPYFEKYVEKVPDERESLELLAYMYGKTGKKAEADKLNKKLDSMEEN